MAIDQHIYSCKFLRVAKVQKSRKTVRSLTEEAQTGNNWLDGYLPYKLYRLTNRLDQRLQNRLRSQGIKPSRWRVMSVLRSWGTLTISRIAELALMEQPTVSRVIMQLEADGLATRRVSTEDSRATDVALTPAGVAKLEEIVSTAYRHQQEALAGLSETELDKLRAMLDHVEQNIDLYQ